MHIYIYILYFLIRNIPLAKSFSVAFKILPAKTTTEVVPSPASIS